MAQRRSVHTGGATMMCEHGATGYCMACQYAHHKASVKRNRNAYDEARRNRNEYWLAVLIVIVAILLVVYILASAGRVGKSDVDAPQGSVERGRGIAGAPPVKLPLGGLKA